MAGGRPTQGHGRRGLVHPRPRRGTSSVDTRTEVLIQAALLELMKGKTCFVIAHRLSTIRKADRIVVIDSGRVVESGTHDSLMEAGGFYAGLYNSQFTSGMPL